MITYWLTFRLLSDTTFGRGDGVAGLVDAEVQHDQLGLPYLGGRTLKGLLGAECAELLYALELQGNRRLADLSQAAQRLFGRPGSRQADTGQVHVGSAHLPPALRMALRREYEAFDAARQGQRQRETLEAFTTVRRQTAVDAVTGAPQANTLRTMRVILRETPFAAELKFLYPILEPAYQVDRGLLAACVRAFRRAGTGRNRGRGRLHAELRSEPDGPPLTEAWFAEFAEAI